MGHRSPVATVATGLDSSPSSAESSFRKLDDVFLQMQTRIWLGEVMKVRLDEQLIISNLLADGELLFEVSKTLWSLLLEKCVELRHIKAYQSPLGSRKSSGRYEPYSNVDSFLKVCKILGLNGIDLFSPSDVVEKRNTRKVCICIRATSKKARSKQLNVPDFDLVSYAVVMPTDMVGCIRRSLESLQCSVSSCSSSNLYKQSRSRNQQRTLTLSLGGISDSCSDESDEAESAYNGNESYLSEEKSGQHATLNLDTKNSPGVFSAVKSSTTRHFASQEDAGKAHRNGNPGYSHHSRNDHQANCLSTYHFQTRGDLQNGFESESELADVDLAVGNDDSDTGDSMFEHVSGNDFISDYLAFSDSIVRNNGSGPFSFDGGDDNICNSVMSIDSYRADSMRRSLDDMEDVEVASTTSMSSVLCRALNMDFDDQYNYVRDSPIVKVHSIGHFEKEADSLDKSSFMEDQTLASSLWGNLSQCSATDITESQSAMKLENGCSSTNLSVSEYNRQRFCMESQKLVVCGDSQLQGMSSSANNTDFALEETETKTSGSGGSKKAALHSSLSLDFEQHGGSHDHVNTLHDKIFTEGKSSLTSPRANEKVLDGKDPKRSAQQDKLLRSLLNTVVKGTTLLGVLFFLLHIRKGKEDTDKPQKPMKKNQGFGGGNPSSQKAGSSSSKQNGTYPAEKLKF